MVILPRNQADPQGTEAIEKKAMRDYRRRIKAATQFYIEAVDAVPVTIVTNAKTYTYQLDAVLLQQLLDNAGRYADELLLEGGAFRPWFFEQYVEVATTRGVAQQIANMAAQSPVYKAARAPAILSEPHLRRMALARARVFEEMKNLSQQVKTDMARILADGIGRGQSPQVIARTMRDQLGIEQFRADRIARTEVATALRRAKWDEADDAADLIGAESREMHYSALSPTTRATHAARHAKIYTRDQARTWWAQGANAINCFLPGTLVAGRFVAGSKSHYRGSAVKIVTASGRNISVTANHPILTQRGWVLAHKVTKADHLFAHQPQVKNPIGVANLDIKDVYTAIEDVYGSIAKLGHSFGRGVEAVDFHGDGVGMDGNISVVRSDGPLAFGVDSSLAEFLDDVKLKHSNSSISHGRGSFEFGFNTILRSPSGLLSSLYSVFSGLMAKLAVAKDGRLGHVSAREPKGFELPADLDARYSVFDAESKHTLSSGVLGMHGLEIKPINKTGSFDSVGLDNSVNGCGADVELFSDVNKTHAGEIFPDDVIGVEVFDFCGHVYDLEEVSGAMAANGLIASNCKCTSVAVLVDRSGNPIAKGIIARAEAAKVKAEAKDYPWSKE